MTTSGGPWFTAEYWKHTKAALTQFVPSGTNARGLSKFDPHRHRVWDHALTKRPPTEDQKWNWQSNVVGGVQLLQTLAGPIHATATQAHPAEPSTAGVRLLGKAGLSMATLQRSDPCQRFPPQRPVGEQMPPSRCHRIRNYYTVAVRRGQQQHVLVRQGMTHSRETTVRRARAATPQYLLAGAAGPTTVSARPQWLETQTKRPGHGPLYTNSLPAHLEPGGANISGSSSPTTEKEDTSMRNGALLMTIACTALTPAFGATLPHLRQPDAEVRRWLLHRLGGGSRRTARSRSPKRLSQPDSARNG